MNWYKSGIYVQYGRVILMNSAMHEHRTCIINLLYGRTGNSIQQYMKSTKVLPTLFNSFSCFCSLDKHLCQQLSRMATMILCLSWRNMLLSVKSVS